MMKTSELSPKSRSRRRVPWFWLALVAGACGGSAGSGMRIGSESHFLSYCTASCGGGFDCIGGICTRSCLTDAASCTDLGASVACTNTSVEPGEVAICDASCADSAGCTELGSGYECRGGFCRYAPSSTGNSSAGNDGGTDVTPPPPPPTSLSCEAFLDTVPAPGTELGVTNNTGRTLYIQPTSVDCEGPQPLVQVQRDGTFLRMRPSGCVIGCERALEQGWLPNVGEGPANDDLACPDTPCGAPPVMLEPGQTVLRSSVVEFAFQRMPGTCAEGATTEAVNCYSFIASPPGNYTLLVQTFDQLGCRAGEQDCECRPDADGSCTNRNVFLNGTATTTYTLEGAPSLAGQRVIMTDPR